MSEVVVLTAPTAAGKTSLALRLAERFPLEVVSADAFLVYRGMDIGTAKPSVLERARVPHHLVDVRDPWEEYDVAQYVREAEAAIADVRSRGKVPLVVGGTGFYLAGLIKGLPTTPRVDPLVQAGLEAELRERGLEALLGEVAAVRPQELVRLQRNPRRVVRSLEVFRRTGRFPSEFAFTSPRFRYRVVAFTQPPEVLDARIAARVEAMFEAGLVEEVRRLLPLHVERDGAVTAWQAIGYKEVVQYLRGEVSLQEAQLLVVAATRSYAKRQLTWIRTQLKEKVLMGEAAAEAELASLLATK